VLLLITLLRTHPLERRLLVPSGSRVRPIPSRHSLRVPILSENTIQRGLAGSRHLDMRLGARMLHGLCGRFCFVGAIQAPLQVPHTWADMLWDFQGQPDADATGHLIFDTVGSLLQHWPNTRYRNGAVDK
jgi:hypothetical protein